jgi:hypothetical protein
VAGRFRIASVSKWRAEAGGSRNVNLGGPASEGCGYLFHTSTRYVSISGVWNGNTIHWGCAAINPWLVVSTAAGGSD